MAASARETKNNSNRIFIRAAQVSRPQALWKEVTEVMKVLSRLVISSSLAVLGAGVVRACPLCESATGERVRAGILNDGFAYHLLVTFLPFPVFLGVVAVMYFGPPWARRPSRRAVAPEPGAAKGS